MSIITKYLTIIKEPEFKLARDLTAMAIADGKVTPEEMEAMKTICHLEGVDEEEMPKTRQGKEKYLRDIIKLIGADGYAAPQEIYLFQIIASRMGLNQMDVIGLFLLTATRQYFKGDDGAKILASFLKNHINPKDKSEMDNRENLRTIYETVAGHTEVTQNEEVDREVLRLNLARATEIFLENEMLIKEFADAGIDFAAMARQEEMRVIKQSGL